MSAVVGYALVGYPLAGTQQRTIETTDAELRAAGATLVFTDDRILSLTRGRPGWAACVAAVHAGDTLLFSTLPCIASTPHYAFVVFLDLCNRGVRVKSLTQQGVDLDITTPEGRTALEFLAEIVKLGPDPTSRSRARARAKTIASLVEASRARRSRALAEQGQD